MQSSKRNIKMYDALKKQKATLLSTLPLYRKISFISLHKGLN